ncbi:MAG: hypothetical protein AAFY71_24480 [Bacteroidota bacterium]
MNILSKTGIDGENRLAGIQPKKDGSCLLVLVQKKKQEVEFTHYQKFEDLELCIRFLVKHPGIPIVLHLLELEGIESIIPTQTKDVLQEAIGVKVDDPSEYFWQLFPGTTQHSWIKVCRRNDLDSAIEQLNPIKSRIVSFSLSDISTAFLLPALAGYNTSTCYYLFEKIHWQGGFQGKNNHAIPISKSSLAGQFDIPMEFISLYGALVHDYMARGQDLFQEDTTKQNRQNLSRELAWVKGLIISLCLAIVIFMAGFLWLQLLEVRVTTGVSVLSANKTLLQKMDTNQKIIQEKSSFFAEKRLKPSKLSKYLDIFGFLRPQGLSFSEVLYAPAPGKLKKIDPALLDQSFSLLLMGDAKSVEDIRKFSALIQQEKWAQKVELWSSTYDFTNKKHQYILLIDLIDD